MSESPTKFKLVADGEETPKDFITIGFSATIHRFPVLVMTTLESSRLGAFGKNQAGQVLRDMMVDAEKYVASQLEAKMKAGELTMPDKPGTRKEAQLTDDLVNGLPDLVADADQPELPDDSQSDLPSQDGPEGKEGAAVE